MNCPRKQFPFFLERGRESIRSLQYLHIPDTDMKCKEITLITIMMRSRQSLRVKTFEKNFEGREKRKKIYTYIKK